MTKKPMKKEITNSDIKNINSLINNCSDRCKKRIDKITQICSMKDKLKDANERLADLSYKISQLLELASEVQNYINGVLQTESAESKNMIFQKESELKCLIIEIESNLEMLEITESEYLTLEEIFKKKSF